ncbi:hypothetical protein RJT34_02764 [Clitoria ternatea]|uniref:Uncharacterized protein n=1 Tax=Clitoria ternatea TaxID=43366 RepID=A0AAN9Q0K2_CLITE
MEVIRSVRAYAQALCLYPIHVCGDTHWCTYAGSVRKFGPAMGVPTPRPSSVPDLDPAREYAHQCTYVGAVYGS